MSARELDDSILGNMAPSVAIAARLQGQCESAGKGVISISLNGLHGGGGMANLLDCRAQEALCRIHALTDEEHRDLWLSMAERWSYLAREETAAFGFGDAEAVPRSEKEQG